MTMKWVCRLCLGFAIGFGATSLSAAEPEPWTGEWLLVSEQGMEWRLSLEQKQRSIGGVYRGIDDRILGDIVGQRSQSEKLGPGFGVVFTYTDRTDGDTGLCIMTFWVSDQAMRGFCKSDPRKTIVAWNGVRQMSRVPANQKEKENDPSSEVPQPLERLPAPLTTGPPQSDDDYLAPDKE